MGGWDGSQYVTLHPRKQCWNVGFRSPDEAAARVAMTASTSASTSTRRERGMVLVCRWAVNDVLLLICHGFAGLG